MNIRDDSCTTENDPLPHVKTATFGRILRALHALVRECAPLVHTKPTLHRSQLACILPTDHADHAPSQPRQSRSVHPILRDTDFASKTYVKLQNERAEQRKVDQP